MIARKLGCKVDSSFCPCAPKSPHLIIKYFQTTALYSHHAPHPNQRIFIPHETSTKENFTKKVTNCAKSLLRLHTTETIYLVPPITTEFISTSTCLVYYHKPVLFGLGGGQGVVVFFNTPTPFVKKDPLE